MDTYRGEIQLALMLSPGQQGKKSSEAGSLFISVKQARSLPDTSSTDGFVKCYLLPDRSTKGKRKTHVIKNSLNPVWEERFGYEKVSLEELSRERVLEVTLWDLNKGASNEFIGGLRLGPAPGRAPKHKEWMDCIGDEVSHWEAMLSRPGEWVEQWHTLRPSMDPRDIDLSSQPPPMALSNTPVNPLPTAPVDPTTQMETAERSEKSATAETSPPWAREPKPSADASSHQVTSSGGGTEVTGQQNIHVVAPSASVAPLEEKVLV